MQNSSVLSFTLTQASPLSSNITVAQQDNEREFVVGSTSNFSGGATLQINRYTSASTGWTPVLAPGTLLPFSMNSAGAGLSLKYFSTAYGTLYQFELIGGDANTIVNIDILSR